MVNGIDVADNTPNGRWLSMPGWAKLITLIGPLGAIACYLVWMSAQTMPRIEQEIQLLRATLEKNQDLIREVRTQTQENYRLSLKVCVKVMTPERIDECFGQK